jgi:pyruvate kinase
MIARGDLGVELPAQKVPLIQNKLIEMANELNKPVIVATQMMESMIDHSRPTRAEVTDVAGACLAGADAVMLSAETAAGKYPVESLSMMDTVLRETEMYQFFNLGGKFRKAGVEKKTNVQDILGIATAQLSRDLMVRSVFVLTRSGYTARMISADRPAAPIIAVTHSKKVQRKLNLLWGVNPYLAPRELAYKPYLAFSEKLIKKLKLGKRGEFVLLTSGFGGDNLATNSIVVHQIP